MSNLTDLVGSYVGRRPVRHELETGIAHEPEPLASLTRERGAAEEHLEVGYRHGDYSPGYADGVLAAFRWLSDPPAR